MSGFQPLSSRTTPDHHLTIILFFGVFLFSIHDRVINFERMLFWGAVPTVLLISAYFVMAKIKAQPTSKSQFGKIAIGSICISLFLVYVVDRIHVESIESKKMIVESKYYASRRNSNKKPVVQVFISEKNLRLIVVVDQKAFDSNNPGVPFNQNLKEGLLGLITL